MNHRPLGPACVLAFSVAACIAITDGGIGGEGVGALCDQDLCRCTEEGIRAAIAQGGGPFTFDCDGPTTVLTEAEIVIDNDVILDGNGHLTVDGNDDHRVFRVLSRPPSGVTAELRGMRITGGSAAGGGGIYNAGVLTLSNVIVSGNRSFFNGGGLFQSGGATSSLTLRKSTVTQNKGTVGGGIYSRGMLVLEKSTVRYNSATQSGGGVASRGLSLRIANTTISANQASDAGGGVYVEQAAGAPVTIESSTLAANDAAVGSGLYWNATARPVIARSLIYANDCEAESTQPSPSMGHNIESPRDTCGFDQLTDTTGVSAADLGLMSLQANGGLTETHALLLGSIAVDMIPDERCELADDQRDVARPQGGACDVGAFELEQP